MSQGNLIHAAVTHLREACERSTDDDEYAALAEALETLEMYQRSKRAIITLVEKQKLLHCG